MARKKAKSKKRPAAKKVRKPKSKSARKKAAKKPAAKRKKKATPKRPKKKPAKSKSKRPARTRKSKVRSSKAPAEATQPKKVSYETAESMAKAQRAISVSEFFAKNRHLLGFDNPRKALLTTVKEAVDNALDACEESGQLPAVDITIEQLSETHFRVIVQDNGPGIVKSQIPSIFGRLLYGSKFHRLQMSRGQQGIGISAAGMYGLLTTGKPVQITSRTGPRAKSHYYELQIDTRKNRPDVIRDDVVDWDAKHGTKVLIELEARYQRGRQSVDDYLEQTAIANPHVKFSYRAPDGREEQYKASIRELPPIPKSHLA